jgi:predicted nucleic acid-binding protein
VIVIDASAMVEWLLLTSAGRHIENRIYSKRETLHAPHVLDLEVAHTFRRLVRERTISVTRGWQGLEDLLALRVLRHPHHVFLPRIWDCRDNLTAYDAAYVVLAEKLAAPLITRDSRLAAASGHSAHIELF